jgi:hypothetical protein
MNDSVELTSYTFLVTHNLRYCYPVRILKIRAGSNVMASRDDQNHHASLLKQELRLGTGTVNSPDQAHGDNGNSAPSRQNQAPSFGRVLYNCDSNNETSTLNLEKGDVVQVLSRLGVDSGDGVRNEVRG